MAKINSAVKTLQIQRDNTLFNLNHQIEDLKNTEQLLDKQNKHIIQLRLDLEELELAIETLSNLKEVKSGKKQKAKDA